ncbi:PEP-CTERM sorting domain-containing protein [Thalassomonas haliotis]|uniref:PEP-CTERM sorting domain-containing protein n=1 Tax=Thalassomonas haliotis TaxID=485448 RepID=A0ABY7VHK8_9GAMM|nr:PEP-CTERM sorting domain-containing protein [Thalassomonas haliotis]WDE12921.1 PEP-CTERM sorting domain-containing protein [Thalassomonas haliotis]
MKRILAGMLSVLLTANVSAALISLEASYSSLSYYSDQIDETLETSFVPYGLSVNIEPTGAISEFSHSGMDVDDEGELTVDINMNGKTFFLSPVSFEHMFTGNMTSFASSFQPGESDVTVDSYNALDVSHVSYRSTVSGPLPAHYGYVDNQNAVISARGQTIQHWEKNDNGLITGQEMVSLYEITLSNGDNNLAYSSYDDLNELYAVLEQAMLDGSQFAIWQNISLYSFEYEESKQGSFCIQCADPNATEVEVERLTFFASAQATAFDYSEVPEPSTNILLLLGLMGLIRLKKRV